ncbi:MAG: hypothetical protein ABJB66_10240 [Gemmatimonadaceae bacterium]
MRNLIKHIVGSVVLSALSISASACSGDNRKSDANQSLAASSSAADKLPPMGAGDVKITSSDNALVLSVIGDTVRMQLSDSLRNSVGKTVDSSMKGGGAIASAIASTVAGAVNGAMGFVVAINVNDIEDLRYEDGHLRFNSKGGKTDINTSGNSRDKATFSADDAQKFIDAVKARQTH